MAVTGQEIFKKAMAKLDELTANGAVNGNAKTDYEQRAIQIINSLLSDMVDISENYKTVIYSNWNSNETFGEYSIQPLPNDLFKVDFIEEYPFSNEEIAYIEGNNLFIKTDYKGQIKLSYIANPTQISSLDDTLVLKDTLANSTLVYGLISELMPDENGTLANLYLQKYQESKIANKPKSKARVVRRKASYSVRG